jgi:hypothetical protein
MIRTLYRPLYDGYERSWASFTQSDYREDWSNPPRRRHRAADMTMNPAGIVQPTETPTVNPK